MAGCGCGDEQRFEGLSSGYRRALWAVIAINAVMFAVEMMAGVRAGSQALKADALDFLGDTLTYGLSLLVIGWPLAVRARAAMLKGLSLALMAAWVLGTTFWQFFTVGVPDEAIMGGIGLLACAANVASVLILLNWRDGDANVRSVWLCSRNDAVGNLAVVGAALLVAATGSAWPDLAVACAMAGLFMVSSIRIIRQALAEIEEARDTRLPEGGKP